jgi:hypothetical protein
VRLHTFTSASKENCVHVVYRGGHKYNWCVWEDISVKADGWCSKIRTILDTDHFAKGGCCLITYLHKS